MESLTPVRVGVDGEDAVPQLRGAVVMSCSVRCEGDGQVFNCAPIIPLLVSRILLNHQRVLCVPACGTKEVVERQVRCCWHNVQWLVSTRG